MDCFKKQIKKSLKEIVSDVVYKGDFSLRKTVYNKKKIITATVGVVVMPVLSQLEKVTRIETLETLKYGIDKARKHAKD